MEEETMVFVAAMVDINFSPFLQKTVENIQKLHIKMD